MKNDVYLSLGSNIKDRFENINQALFFLEKKFGRLKVSGFYNTAPTDYKDQDFFINCCVFFKTEYDPFEVFKIIKETEHVMGQFKKEIRFGPRIIDIDLIFFSDLVIETDELTIPHKRLHKRGFVLYPLMDINKELVHPVLKKSIKELALDKNIVNQLVQKTEDKKQNEI
ncbi:MAG: 2-amino-4-hydroxy-6-hydroxymethyldihydropteridine diphosphokinase [Thermodesulfobacteriota bacterium]